MSPKSANLYARIEPDVKEQAEAILAALGIPASNAINMFYKQIILHRGLPFRVSLNAASDAEREGAMRAFLALRAQARANGVADMALDVINEEISRARRQAP